MAASWDQMSFGRNWCQISELSALVAERPRGGTPTLVGKHPRGGAPSWWNTPSWWSRTLVVDFFLGAPGGFRG